LRAIAGRDEGIYAWVSANYALGTLHGDPLQTTGIIELGGASTQVSSHPLAAMFVFIFCVSVTRAQMLREMWYVFL
jgi:Golgi nucleoside diphosphatase